MPLLNYTTKVDVYTTLGAIQGQLVRHGAKKIMQDYNDEGQIAALSFLIDTPAGPRGIRERKGRQLDRSRRVCSLRRRNRYLISKNGG